jgi:AhpD family alkylhydroperoxidase
MQTRIDYKDAQPAIQALLSQSGHEGETELEQSLLDLVVLRASQINRCAYCIDMHFKDAIASGEDIQRLYGLDAWREAPYYTDRERAALAWTEAVTLVSEDGVPDDVYGQVRQHFNAQEIVGLTMVVININGWNRLNASLQHTVPGRYKSQRKPVLNAESVK